MLPAQKLANASTESYEVAYARGDYGYGDFYYGPYVDGVVIRDLPSQEFKQGHFTQVPLLTNREGYEGYIFSNPNETTTTQEIQDLATLFPNAKKSFFTRLFELYPRSDFNSTLFQRQTLFGDFVINCPTFYVASAVSDAGKPVYKMVFDAGTQIHGALQSFVESTNINGTDISFLSESWY